MFISYLKLAIVSLLPPLFAFVLVKLNKRGWFSRINPLWQQVIYGAVFGGLAVMGTEFGIPITGAQVNCRDGAVITAGLFFGAPAGIIAGLIGGIERWVAVAWGVGRFTRLACSVSTVAAGVFSALVRRRMLDDTRPTWGLAFITGIVVEVFHLTMVFVTNMSQSGKAIDVVFACSAPMITANSLAVAISALVVARASGEKKVDRAEKKAIAQVVQKEVMTVVIITFFVTSFFLFRLQSALSTTQIETNLSVAINSVEAQINEIYAENGADITDTAAETLEQINKPLAAVAKNSTVGATGFVVVTDEVYFVVSAPESFKASNLSTNAMRSAVDGDKNVGLMRLDGKNYFVSEKKLGHYRIVGLLPSAEGYRLRNVAVLVNSFLEVMVFGLIFVLFYTIIKRVVVVQIKKVNMSLSLIAAGHLDEKVEVDATTEFEQLSEDINTTVGTLNRYIEEASARIDSELAFANEIQMSSLPVVTPALARREEFDIAAFMTTAKEVGGDFYDFYTTNNGETLNFLIADVSGKGIPAAMFMMRAKTELRTLTEAGIVLNDAFTSGNKALCDGNTASMFVTAWQGALDMKTGELKFVNAGHNPPLVRHKDGTFEYLKARSGFVLASIDTIKYRLNTITLEPGDIVFMYTDGVTEATDASNSLYGEERLRDLLNKIEIDSMDSLCADVMKDVDAFVDGAPQFDDITMVAMRYNGVKHSPSISFDRASIEDIPAVTEFVEGEMERMGCSMKSITRMNVAIDEIYSNIAKFAYNDGQGPVTVKVRELFEPHMVRVTFVDSGRPYNPMTAIDPDVTLSAEDRKIGGLGVYLVKKTMDDMQYKYADDKNILMLFKKIED